MPDSSLNDAITLHQAGKLDDARAIYQQLIAADERNAEAWHLLGLTDYQQGRLAPAARHIEKALGLSPNVARYWSNFGEVKRAGGNVAAALGCQDRALALDPAMPAAHYNRGLCLQAQRRFDEAIAAYRRAVELRPSYADAWFNLGGLLLERNDPIGAEAVLANVLRLQPQNREAELRFLRCERALGRFGAAQARAEGLLAIHPHWVPLLNDYAALLSQQSRHDEAIAALTTAVNREPECVELRRNLGLAYRAASQPEAAAAVFADCVRRRPDFHLAYDNLGMSLHELGRHTEAEAALRQGLMVKSDCADTWNNLGLFYERMNRVKEAVLQYRRALELDPNHAAALQNLGNVAANGGEPSLARRCFLKALAIAPDSAAVHSDFGHALMQFGDHTAARAELERALELEPSNPGAADNALMTLLYDERITPEQAAQAHMEWAARVERSVAPWPRRGTRAGRITLGFVSGDLWTHPVAQFLEPLLQHLDRERFRVIAFSNRANADATTERLRQLVDEWQDIRMLSDAAAAVAVERHGVDILVDLSGHTGHNRLRLFPFTTRTLNVTFLGYPHSTGLRSMHVRLGDPLADPPGNERYCSERLVRFPTCAWCLPRMQEEAAWAPGATDTARPDHFVFGCFNAVTKFSDPLLVLWARILAGAPEATLRLGSKFFGDAQFLEEFWRRWECACAAAGVVPPPRVRVQCDAYVKDRDAHFRRYHEVDVALDSFPFHGTTTTCDALSMGVPILTLTGATHVSRVGLSLLHYAGLPEFVAASADDYVARAVRLAANGPRDRRQREALRAQILASPLGDVPRYAREFEQLMAALLESPPTG